MRARVTPEDSARGGGAATTRERDAKRARRRRDRTRARCSVLLGQATETTDRRRRGTLAAIARAREGGTANVRSDCGRSRRRTSGRRRSWRARARRKRGRSARRSGRWRSRSAQRAAALEAIVGGRDRRGGKRKTDAASADADAAPRTPGGETARASGTENRRVETGGERGNSG